MADFAEIRIVEFIENHEDDSGLAIRFEVVGPGNQFEALRVSFSEKFIEDYFKVPWQKDLAKEAPRIIRGKKEMFIKWAVLKVEAYLVTRKGANKILIEAGKDVEWAKQVTDGQIKMKSEPRSEHLFFYPAS